LDLMLWFACRHPDGTAARIGVLAGYVAESDAREAPVGLAWRLALRALVAAGWLVDELHA
jgi:hypothetical protein